MSVWCESWCDVRAWKDVLETKMRELTMLMCCCWRCTNSFWICFNRHQARTTARHIVSIFRKRRNVLNVFYDPQCSYSNSWVQDSEHFSEDLSLTSVQSMYIADTCPPPQARSQHMHSGQRCSNVRYKQMNMDTSSAIHILRVFLAICVLIYMMYSCKRINCKGNFATFTNESKRGTSVQTMAITTNVTMGKSNRLWNTAGRNKLRWDTPCRMQRSLKTWRVN